MTRARRPLLVLALGAAAIAAVAATGWWGGYRLNFTRSYPLGLWRIVAAEAPIAVGDRVFICIPQDPALSTELARGYVRGGVCPGRASPLIKTVAALPGQIITIDRSVMIDGRPLHHSEIHGVDAEGRALAAYAGGVVPDGHLYLHSDFEGSYDSRYFGPVPAAGLLGLARPVATFDP